MEWIVKRFDSGGDSEHQYSQENLAFADRLVGELPRPGMRRHYRDFFNSEPQTDNILLEVLNLVRIHVAMYGYSGFAHNEPHDKSDYVFGYEHLRAPDARSVLRRVIFSSNLGRG